MLKHFIATNRAVKKHAVMNDNVIIVIISGVAAALVILTLSLFLAGISRRAFNSRKYRKLDALQELFHAKLLDALQTGSLSAGSHEFRIRPGSLEWQALESVLIGLIALEQYRSGAKQLFSSLGFVKFHEDRLAGRNIQRRAISIDKLGKMQSQASVPKIVPLLDDRNPEIATVAARSLGRIGGQEAMDAVVVRIPALLREARVASKALESDLSSFGPAIIPYLLRREVACPDAASAAIVLETLSRLPAQETSIRFAETFLSHQNAEVRSKALKVLGRTEKQSMEPHLSSRIDSMLNDPVWFVRLQAIRTLRSINDRAVADLVRLAYDEKWLVRNEALRALITLGQRPLDILLEVLSGADAYARESACEEIENTGFDTRVISCLGEPDAAAREKSRRILAIMHAHGFSTPLMAYLEQGDNHAVKEQLRGIVQSAPGTL